MTGQARQSLQEKYPVGGQWSTVLNGDVEFNAVDIKAGKSSWWECEDGHVQHTRIGRRFKNGCRQCNSRNTLVKINKKFWKENTYLLKFLNVKEYPDENLYLEKAQTPLQWVCAKEDCHNIFYASRSDRNRKDNRRMDLCKVCANRKRIRKHRSTTLKRSGSLLDNFPEIAKEWCYDLNKKSASPSNITPGSNESFWFQCKFGHKPWKSRVTNRTHLKRNCPSCYDPSTSKLEQRLFTEFNSYSNFCILREKIFGHEADLFFPSINTIVECDGYPWHSTIKKETIDNKKSLTWNQHGIKVVRIRDDKLKSLGGLEIFYKESGIRNHLHICERLAKLLLQQYPRSKELNKICKHYKTLGGFISDDRYQALSEQRVSVKGMRLSESNPELVSEWDDIENYPVTPDRIARGSDYRAHWICNVCGNKFISRVANRTSLKRGCNVCAIKKVQSSRMRKFLSNGNTLKDTFPQKSLSWDFEKNKPLTPKEVTPYSNRKVWWKCNKCGKTWEQAVCARVKSNYQNCHYCKS